MAGWTPPEVAATQARADSFKPPAGDRPAPAPEPSEPGIGTDIATMFGPTLRGASPYAAGALVGAGIPTAMGMPMLAPAGAAAGAGAVGLTELGGAIYNPIASMTGLPQMPTPSQVTGRLLTKMGVPESAPGLPRVVESVAGAAASTAGQARMFTDISKVVKSDVAQKLLSTLGAGPGTQMASSATGSAAAQTVSELGGGPVAQLAASVVGGGIPGFVSGGPRAVLGGTSSLSNIQERVNQARGMGVEPNVAFAAPSMVARGAQRALSGTEESQQYAARVTKQIESEANRIADRVGKSTNPNAAGIVIQDALGGKDGFLQRAKAVEGTLWDKWFNIADKKQVAGAAAPGQMPMNNTMAYLAKSQRNIEGAEELSQLMKDPQLGRILKAMTGDMPAPGQQASVILGPNGQPITTPTPGKGTIPYEAVKQLRTIIGEKLDPNNMSPDVNRNALKALYATLSEDIGAYAKQLGPEAEKAFNRANMFTRGKHDRIDTYLQEIMDKKPYEAFRYATKPDAVAGGGHQFLAINRSLSPEARQVFHSTFIKQMGNDNGVFNPRQFVDKYEQLTPTVRSALLPGEQGKATAKLVETIKGMDKAGVFGGNKDSSPYLGAYILMGALLHANPKAILTVAFASSKSEKIAKMLTNPEVVDYVSGVNKIPKQQATALLNSFANTMKTVQSEE